MPVFFYFAARMKGGNKRTQMETFGAREESSTRHRGTNNVAKGKEIKKEGKRERERKLCGNVVRVYA